MTSLANLRQGQPDVSKHMTAQQTIEVLLSSPATSAWLKSALESALLRDPVDAANDAEALASLLVARFEEMTGQAPAQDQTRH